MSDINFSDEDLLEKFASGGFSQVIANLGRLGEYLDNRAVETGLAAPIYLREAVRLVETAFKEHNEYGGIRIGFVKELDSLVYSYLPDIQRGDPLQSVKRARQFRDEIFARVRDYDVLNTYE